MQCWDNYVTLDGKGFPNGSTPFDPFIIILTLYINTLSASVFRYAPYPMPSGAAAAHSAHAHLTQGPSAAQQQTAHAPQAQQAHPHQHQHQHQHQQALAAQASTPVAAHNPYQAYGLPNVDMSSFQGVDWSSMYGMGMYAM